MPKFEKPRQERKTLQDTMDAQTELLILIKRKKERNSILSIEERERFIRIYPVAVQAHGSNPCLYKTRTGAIVRFDHLDAFSYFLREQTKDYVDIINEDTGQIYDTQIPITDLWKFFERKIVHILPFAREEAAHMSAEAPTREAPSSFVFSSEKKLE